MKRREKSGEGGRGSACWGNLFFLPDTEVFHVPDHFCFTTD